MVVLPVTTGEGCHSCQPIWLFLIPLFPAFASGNMADGFLGAVHGISCWLTCFRLVFLRLLDFNRFIDRGWFLADIAHDPLDMLDDLPAGDEASAFILPVGVLVFRTPEEVVAVEILIDIIPAAHAAMGAVNPVWGLEFADGQ